ncbi:hypothetical protein GCM10027423_35820 [Spirosoma arcticum]
MGFYGFERYLQKIAQVVSGINFRVMAANRIITDYKSGTIVTGATSTPTTSTTATETPFKIGVIGMRGGLFREFLEPELVRQKFSVIAGFDWDFRIITGDLRNAKSDQVVRDFQKNVVRNEYIRFSGFNAYFLLRLKNIRAIIEYTNITPYERRILGFVPNRRADAKYFQEHEPDRVPLMNQKIWPGLTNGQITFTIAFTGGFPVKFD